KGKLELYDQCLPNRKKYFALCRIWGEGMGFLEAFRLLGIELSEQETLLAQKLDAKGYKPKGFYRIMDRLTKSARFGETAPSQTCEAGFEKDGSPVPLVDFDYEAIYASLDGVEAESIKEPKPIDSEDWDRIKAWRPYFSIQKPNLSHRFAGMNPETRKAWVTDASQRIESSWPAKLETEL